jgi:hypothetical protein
LYFYQHGGFMGIELVVDSLDSVPAFQQSWYEQDASTKKFKLNPSKVEIEDVVELRKTVEATRKEAKALKQQQDQRIREALAPFEGIDPVKMRELMGQFDDAEEAKLLAKGKDGIEQIINKRMEKARLEFQRKLEDAEKGRKGALDVASTFMSEVLDNKVRAVLEKAGLHPGAIDDALLHARNIFSLDDNRQVVQFEEDGKTVVLGKDGKTPFGPKEWIETMKESKPHWFPSGNSGGNAHNSRSGSGANKTITRAEFNALPPSERKNWIKPGQVVD